MKNLKIKYFMKKIKIILNLKYSNIKKRFFEKEEYE
jgi:hypothetical protein